MTITRFASALLLACAVALPAFAKDAYSYKNAVIRETPMNVAAGYVTVRNPTAEADTLLRASADWAGRIELHQVKADSTGVMQMSKTKAIDLPAKGEMVLRPGGYHLMIFGAKEKLKVGQTRDITLHFKSNTNMIVPFSVQPISYKGEQASKAAAEDHSHHMHH